MAERIGVLALCVVLSLSGMLAWRLQTVPQLAPDASLLAELPTRVGLWRSIEIPMDAAVEAELRADLNIQRTYRLPTGDLAWLYIGYYGTASGGRPEHTPRNCYVSADWGIEASQVLTVDEVSGLRVNEYLIERAGERRLVHFWFRSYRRTGMLGGLDQALDRMLGRISEGRADGALARVSAPVAEGDAGKTRAQLMRLATEIDRELAGRWPVERAVVLADAR